MLGGVQNNTLKDILLLFIFWLLVLLFFQQIKIKKKETLIVSRSYNIGQVVESYPSSISLPPFVEKYGILYGI